jgi:hypothetical protein
MIRNGKESTLAISGVHLRKSRGYRIETITPFYTMFSEALHSRKLLAKYFTV